MSEKFEWPLTDTPIELNGISFISFYGGKDGIYQIDTYVGAGDYTGQYYVAEKDLANVLSPSLAEYIKQASQLTEPIGTYDSYGAEDNDWEYGCHYVPIQREFNVPKEYAQELNRIVGRNNMIVPTRINDVDITPEQQIALKMGELIVVKGVSKGDEKKTLAVWLDREQDFCKMEVPPSMENAPLSEIERLTKVPTKINGMVLSDEQRIDLKEGKAINVPSAGKPSETVKVKMVNGQPLVIPRQVYKQETKPVMGRKMR